MQPLLAHTITHLGPAIRLADTVAHKLGPIRDTDTPWFEDRSPLGAAWVDHSRRARAALAPLRRDLCLDAPTVDVVGRCLVAMERREPLLLRGDPGTSKTAGAELAGRLLGLDVIRVSFSARTDADELFGRWVPAAAGGFEFADGPVVRAVREGALLILDEVNLASAAAVDRLLPLLEDRRPPLALPERRGEVVPVHPHFRMIAAINPTGHAGRRPLSPAFLDRVAQLEVRAPDVADLERTIRYLTGLRGHPFRHAGDDWAPPRPPAGIARFGPLASADGWESLVGPLARFVHGLSANPPSDESPIGRRALVRFLTGLTHAIGDGRALGFHVESEIDRYFLSGVPVGRRPAIAAIAAAEGLRPHALRRAAARTVTLEPTWERT